MDSFITVTGNITREPELKFGEDGLARIRFGIASTWKTKTRENTSFYDVVVFGKIAENIHASLAKGNHVIVTGRQEVREYERKDGTKGTAVEIIASEVGPSLRFATVNITKNERNTAPAGNDGWEEF